MSQFAIVTGASGNLGQAVVKKFLREGITVAGTIVPNDPIQLSINNKQFSKTEVDLASEEAASQFVQNIIIQHSRIDIAVLTVGGFTMGKISETSVADIQKMFRLNFETAYNIARPVFTQMLHQNTGRIFMVGARPGLNSRYSKGMVAYGLSKSLIFRLSQLMNEEAKGTDVTVNVIVPSTIDTPENRKGMPNADFSKWVKPESIADIIHFYCTDKAAALKESIIKVYHLS